VQDGADYKTAQHPGKSLQLGIEAEGSSESSGGGTAEDEEGLSEVLVPSLSPEMSEGGGGMGAIEHGDKSSGIAGAHHPFGKMEQVPVEQVDEVDQQAEVPEHQVDLADEKVTER
jgi:hypothetical protein